MKTERAYLALGTNLGDRRSNLEEAIRRLAALGTVAARSSIIETEPWGVKEQPHFLNMVLALETRLPPEDLLRAVKNIEQDMGRVPAARYGPRLIDIDLLLYGEETIDSPELTIPHPRMSERDFVLVPLAEIAPDLAARHRRLES